MGQRLRALVLLLVLVGVGVLLGSSLAQWWPQGPGRRAGPDPFEFQGRVRVEVLNAGGTAGVAREATGALREHGLDVVYWGNAENFSEGPSVVMDRVGRAEVARAVAEVLGIHQVLAEPDSTLLVDVTVRLGRDWSLPAEAGAEATEDGPWWDPRRFLPARDSAGSG